MGIRDVAKQAGVSIGTVSRAFNNYGDINNETKKRIFEVAGQLGYTPNVNAKSLSVKVSSNIGVIISGFIEGSNKDNLMHEALKGILKYSLQNDLEVSIYGTDSTRQTSKSYARFCSEHSISGAILSGITMADPYFKELVNSKIPCVTIDVDINVNQKNIGGVSIDNVSAATQIADYLINFGHKNIVIVSGKKNAMVTLERMSGVEQAFISHNLNIQPQNILYCDYSEQVAYEKTLQYLNQYGNSATAFLCFSDLMALGVLKAARAAKLRVPEDISITGFDGIPITEYTLPAITTIEQDMISIGYEGARLLHKIVRNEPHERHVFVSHNLLERESVARCLT